MVSVNDSIVFDDAQPGNGATYIDLAMEYALIFATLVPLSGGALASVTTYQFRRFYLNPTFDTWKLKYNKVYPSVPAVTNEIIALTKCTLTTIMLLAFSVQLGIHGYNGLFDVRKATIKDNVVNFIISFWAVDFYSYFYHFIGHKIPEAWTIHRFHHKFFNPTPFGVIADDCLDQLIRAMPLLFLPLAIDTLNWVVLSSVFALDMYYGVLLHGGHENVPARKVADFFEKLCGVDIINTPLNHYLHHAISGGSTPKYCGFYVTLWDKLFGSEDKDNLAKMLTGIGSRTEAEFKKIELPEYSALGTIDHWKDVAKEARKGTKED